MKGYVARKGDNWYTVIYEGLDPVTDKERRSWHPAGSSREDAELLAGSLAAELTGCNEEVRALTFGAYLTERWLPGKRLALAASTWDGYRRKIDRHILPMLGRIPIRRLRDHHLERLYGQKLHPSDGTKPLAPKTVLEIHLIIRSALNDAVRKGLVSRNVALVADAPKLRSIPRVEQQAWTAPQLQAFLREAAAHRLFPAMWLVANTGLRRSELLGLKWDDVDYDTAALSVNRGLVAVGYKLHETRGTAARRPRPSNAAGSLRLAGLAADQTNRHRSRICRLGVHRRRRSADTPTFVLAGLRQGRHPSRRAQSATPRRPPHPRDLADQSRRASEGRVGTARTRQPGVHNRHLPTRPPWHASRSGADLREPDQPRVNARRPWLGFYRSFYRIPTLEDP